MDVVLVPSDSIGTRVTKWYPVLDPIYGCRQNLDPLLDPSIFSVKKKKKFKWHWQYVCYIPPLLSQFGFLRFSVQLERRCSPPRHAFPSSRLVFLRGIRNFLVITYSDNFRKTCHFQVAWTPAILFSAIWPVQSRGVAFGGSTKMIFVFQSQQELRSYFSEGNHDSVLFPEWFSVWERLVVNLVSCAWVVPGRRGFVLMPSFIPYWFAQLPKPGVFRRGEI